MIHSALHFLMGKGPDFRSLGRRFRGEHAELDWSDALTGLAILAAAVLLSWLLKRFSSGSGPRSYRSPHRLFQELCKAHGLDSARRRLLKRLARLQGLKEHPARLFLELQRFGPEELPESMQKHADELAELRGRLFE